MGPVIDAIIPQDLARQEKWQRVKDMVLDTVFSPHSKRAYDSALDEFLCLVFEPN
jgi:hypothetical protein